MIAEIAMTQKAKTNLKVCISTLRREMRENLIFTAPVLKLNALSSLSLLAIGTSTTRKGESQTVSIGTNCSND
jgi:hypothetical protein